MRHGLRKTLVFGRLVFNEPCLAGTEGATDAITFLTGGSFLEFVSRSIVRNNLRRLRLGCPCSGIWEFEKCK
jgi:hypothetical protein